MNKYQAARRIVLNRRKARRNQFANAKVEQPQALPPKKHKLRNAARS